MKRKSSSVLITVGPAALWLILFIALPILFVFVISFLTQNIHGGVIFKPSIDGYQSIFSSANVSVFTKSIAIAVITTIICILLGYPFAAILARAKKSLKNVLQMSIMLPFWINSLILISGWEIILRDNGIINSLLQWLHITDAPIKMMDTQGAVIVGMVYTLFPFMVLPLFSSIEKLDKSLLEASGDLGAKPVRTFFRVILPLTMPGIFAGSIQVFVPSLGYYYVADRLGGGKTLLIGNLINNQFNGSSINWPYGAAVSIVLIAITLILLKLYSKIGSVEDLA